MASKKLKTQYYTVKFAAEELCLVLGVTKESQRRKVQEALYEAYAAGKEDE